MRLRLEKRQAPSMAMLVATPVAAVLLTMVIGGVVFDLIGINGFKAVVDIFLTPLLASYKWQDVALKAAPLIARDAVGLSIPATQHHDRRLEHRVSGDDLTQPLGGARFQPIQQRLFQATVAMGRMDIFVQIGARGLRRIGIGNEMRVGGDHALGRQRHARIRLGIGPRIGEIPLHIGQRRRVIVRVLGGNRLQQLVHGGHIVQARRAIGVVFGDGEVRDRVHRADLSQKRRRTNDE